MPLPPWFDQFCAPDADRLKVLAQVLHDSRIVFEVVKTGSFRHIQVRSGLTATPQPGETVLIAHYDRVLGTPGANDNGASVLALVEFLCRDQKKKTLRVVFTDGEELSPGASAADQGAYALAKLWGPIPGLFPVVFDMTGIGDTVVLGHLGGKLAPGEAYDQQRLRAKRFLATCGAGDTVEVNTPFSDDLGFFLAGTPAVQISLLPRKQALAYRRLRAEPGELSGKDAGPLPPAWLTMHTADDRPEALWPSSRILMAEMLFKLESYPGWR